MNWALPIQGDTKYAIGGNAPINTTTGLAHVTLTYNSGN
jgi:2-oxoglutarate dehydrogenase complex dehydrogenase (E1) component-like enzyme